MSEQTYHSLRTGQPITYGVWKKDYPVEDDSKNCVAWEKEAEWLNEECNGGTDRGVLCRVLDPIPPLGIDPLTGMFLHVIKVLGKGDRGCFMEDTRPSLPTRFIG